MGKLHILRPQASDAKLMDASQRSSSACGSWPKRGGKNGCGMLWNMDENGTSIDDLLRKNGGSHGFSNSH